MTTRGVEAVASSQQPSRQALFDVVQTVAGGILRHLHRANRQAHNENPAQFGGRGQKAPDGGLFNLKGVAWNLNHNAMSELIEAGDNGQADQVFASGNADFDAPSVLRLHYQRGNPAVHEIHGYHRLMLAQQKCAGIERDESEMSFDGVKLALRNSQKNGVANSCSRRCPWLFSLGFIGSSHQQLDDELAGMPSREAKVFACRESVQAG